MDLTNKELDDDDAADIAGALTCDGRCEVESLNLSGNRFSDKGIAAIATRLLTNEWLKGLNLGGNPVIGAQGAITLSVALSFNTSLLLLNLGGCNMGDAEVSTLVSGLETNPNLSKLYLCSNSIGNLGASALATVLRKAACPIERLWLGNNKIQDSGVNIIAEAVSYNARLQWLDLSVNAITDNSAIPLVSMLFTNVTLQTLDLHGNKITGSGAVVALAGAATASTSLSRLDLRHNYEVESDQAQKIAKALKPNSIVQLDNVHLQTPSCTRDHPTGPLLLSHVVSLLSPGGHPYSITSLEVWIAADHEGLDDGAALEIDIDARPIQLKLMQWLSETAQREADKDEPFELTQGDRELIKCIARLYHKLVPIQKAAAKLTVETVHTVFIAHSGMEKDGYASPIQTYLEDKGLSAFLDQKMAFGTDPEDEMMGNACSCRVMWCVLSKNFITSKHAMHELLVGYTRHMTEDKFSFCLLLDCFETEYSRGDWMNQVLGMRALKLYKKNGMEHRFPVAIRAKTDENFLERIKRIAASKRSGKHILVAEDEPRLNELIQTSLADQIVGLEDGSTVTVSSAIEVRSRCTLSTGDNRSTVTTYRIKASITKEGGNNTGVTEGSTAVGGSINSLASATPVDNSDASSSAVSFGVSTLGWRCPDDDGTRNKTTGKRFLLPPISPGLSAITGGGIPNEIYVSDDDDENDAAAAAFANVWSDKDVSVEDDTATVWRDDVYFEDEDEDIRILKIDVTRLGKREV